MDGHHEPAGQPAACAAFEMSATYLQENGEWADIVLHDMHINYEL